MSFFFKADPVSVKVRLGLASHDNHKHNDKHEHRCFVLHRRSFSCCGTTFSSFIQDIGDRFSVPVLQYLTYTDIDGDSVTVDCDEDLTMALKSGVPLTFTAFRIKKAPFTATTQWVDSITFWINDQQVVVENPDPSVTLLDWMREQHGLLGIHVGCGEGGCGICTVAVTCNDPLTGTVKTVPMNSCLRRLAAVDGCHILTSEGIGKSSSGFHPIQKAIADGNGSQCGFCTPGWVMQMYSLLATSPTTPTPKDIETNFDGNLCRCTGYRPILSAFGKLTTELVQPIANPTMGYVYQPLHFTNSETGQEYFRPLSLSQLFEVVEISKTSGKTLRFICAGTADGVTKYVARSDPTYGSIILVDTSRVADLAKKSYGAAGLTLGSTLTLQTVIDQLLSIKGVPAYTTLASHIKRVASVQIRSVASWSGNLILTKENSAFASDLATILSAVGALVTVQSLTSNSTQVVSVPDLLAISSNVLVLQMTIPVPPSNSTFSTFKTSQRHVFAHAIVNFGGYLEYSSTGVLIKSRIAIGGACESLLMANDTSTFLVGKTIVQATFDQAVNILVKEISANPSIDPRHSQSYRQNLACTFLYKLFLENMQQHSTLPARLQSTLVPFVTAESRPVSSGTESWSVVPNEAPIGTYIPKLDSRIQASGEARYPSDYGAASNGVSGALFGQLVLSSRANAKLTKLDPADALVMPGVVDFVTVADIPGKNQVNGHLAYAGTEASRMELNGCEKVFYTVGDTVPHVGAPLGLVVADTWAHARRAAKAVVQQFDSGLVHVQVDPAFPRTNPKPLDKSSAPAVDAGPIGQRQLVNPQLVSGGSWTNKVTESQSTVSTATGKFRTGGQRHFYMETQSVLASVRDGGMWEVISSDQWGATTHLSLAIVLGVPDNQINVICPRAGGAFGGKLTRQLIASCAAVVAVNKLGRPVRIQIERSDDLQMCAGREPLDFDYTVTFDNTTGKVNTLDITMTIDPGWYAGDAVGSIAFATSFVDNCYQYSTLNVNTEVQLTDTPHSTSMRAPGCMQSIMASEVVMEHVAKLVGKPTAEIQELNFYDLSTDPVTPVGDHLGKYGYDWTIPTLWSESKSQFQFDERKAEIEKFNENNRYVKKGLAITPGKYPMNITVYHTGVLVNIYPDGTVFVSTGCSEIGQGLNTKVSMIVAETLGCPIDIVKVGSRQTNIIPNNSGTGGSGTSETAANAAAMACKDLMSRLKPYMQNGNSFFKAVAAANGDKVSLMSTGFSVLDGTENHNVYATYGVAVSEVMIDILTGEVRIERVDILMDLGNQLDAAVDIGQIQGGFIMSLGYLLTEELKVNSTGAQLNLGTWEYKIPSAYDIPLDFNIALLKNSPNPVGVKGSKACAEPSMMLISSVYLAVKEAIYAARQEMSNGNKWFMLDLPLTCEAIRGAVGAQELDIPGAK